MITPSTFRGNGNASKTAVNGGDQSPLARPHLRHAAKPSAILPTVNAALQPLDLWLLRNRRGVLTLAAALAAFVPICWIVIQLNGSFPGDSYFISWMRNPSHHRRVLPAFYTGVFTALSDPIVAALCVVVVWILVHEELGPRYGALVLATVGVVAFNALLKTILGPTPLQISAHGALASDNFPSGHVVYITALCGLLGWFALARGHHPVYLAMLLLILGIGPIRILERAHWPSDVLAGYALALAWTLVVLVIGLPWATGQSPTDPTGATWKA
jgi:membrane-associated phospholipid phosphatase